MASIFRADLTSDSYPGKPRSEADSWLGRVVLVSDTDPKPGDRGKTPGASDSTGGASSLFGSLLKGAFTPEAMEKLLPSLLKNSEFKKSFAELMEDPGIRKSMASMFGELLQKPEFRDSMVSMFKGALQDKEVQSALLAMMQRPEFRQALRPMVAELANDPQIRKALKETAIELANDSHFRQALKSAALEMIGGSNLLGPLMASLNNPRTMNQIMSSLPMLLSMVNRFSSGFPMSNPGQGYMPPYWNMPRNNLGMLSFLPRMNQNFPYAPFSYPPFAQRSASPFSSLRFGPLSSLSNQWAPRSMDSFYAPYLTAGDAYYQDDPNV